MNREEIIEILKDNMYCQALQQYDCHCNICIKQRNHVADKIMALQPTEEEIDEFVEPITGFKHGNSGDFLDEIVRNGINWFKNFKRIK